MSPADVVIMKLLPIQRQCAAHQRNWPKHWGCRVMRITPVSHRCSLGLSTAATCSQQMLLEVVQDGTGHQRSYRRSWR